MTKINDGGPAFPALDFNRQPDPNASALFPGMSLRDWFAGQALAGIICKSPFVRVESFHEAFQASAMGAYEYADAMLAERSKSQGQEP
ncbi:hypothetical protein [Chelativorans sp. Marseille-P2723]|uniref:hypothetical protein n=1 Tax=Chelativorans sp. Marseille-P2723 TaxID=2709133 RepID=UPI00156F3F8D|nr:hypothetical protein [Chelativorans sp. Marseille-P2723]